MPLARRMAAIDAWLPRTCAANSSLATPVARVSSAAMSGVSSAQPTGCQESPRRIAASPVSRGPGPADRRRVPSRSSRSDRASRTMSWPSASRTCSSGPDTSRTRQFSSDWAVSVSWFTGSSS